MARLPTQSVARKAAFIVSLSCSLALSGCQPTEPSAEEAVYTQTTHPIVLVHGLYGFDNIFGIEYFHKIAPVLRSGGAEVYALTVSGINTPEVRGEQLIEKLDELAAISGAEKFNLFGHSLGSPTIRYVASTRPDLVASVTSVAGVNAVTPLAGTMSPIIDFPLIGGIVNTMGNLLGKVIDVVQQEKFVHDTQATAAAMTGEGMAEFNAEHPQGVPAEYCGEGDEVVDGIYYYSWGGNVAETNRYDPLDLLHKYTTRTIAGDDDDGFIPRCSMHLGKVIRDDYALNHLDQMNWFLGLRRSDAPEPSSLYRTQANRLKLLGL